MERVEPASTSYRDWVGTAAAENSIIVGSGDLYELAGLDHERWSILGIDAWANSHGVDPDWTVHVYAFDKTAAEVSSHDELIALAAERGSVPVTDILLHNVGLDDLIRCMKTVHVQFRSPNFLELDVVDRGDHPPQD